jgi:vacuolar-type H+-ATPase subunit H
LPEYLAITTCIARQIWRAAQTGNHAQAEEAQLKFRLFIPIIVVCLFANAGLALAQAPIVTLQLGPDQIGVVRTSVGITTRITFPEPVADIICGDLYNAADGKGTFVVQRSGTTEKPGNDVYVKPVASKGQSNMFVKTGDGKHTYNFDLTIVPPATAHRVVNVTDAAPPALPAPTTSNSTPTSNGASEAAKPAPCPDADRIRADAEEQGRRKADEVIRNARQQADRITGEAEAKLAEANRQSSERTGQESDRRFLQALMLGLREVKITNPKATTKKKIIVTLDSRVMLFDEKAYIRYTIQNAGNEDFSFTSLTLEAGLGAETRPLTIEVVQNKPENKLAANETLTGVIVFDPKQVEAKDKVTFYLRAEDHLEIAHVTVQ